MPDTHMTNITQTEQVVFMFLGIYMCTHANTHTHTHTHLATINEKESMHLKEQGGPYGRFGG